MFLDNLRGYFSTDVAMDLGTANTLVWVKGRGIVLNEPSVVAVEKSSNRVLAVGSEAKLMLGRTPDEINAVRPLKDGVIADFQVTEHLLKTFVQRVQRHRLVKPYIIVCVPSGITEVEKRAVIDSAMRGGCGHVDLVYEPIAAAIGVDLPVETPTGNMVVDIGGGTTEIAVIALNGIVTKTSIRTGGDEMDDAIMNYAKKAYNMLIGEQTAERIKIEIGSAFPLPEEMDMEIKGRDLVRGIPRTLRVSSVEIREALQEPVGQIVNALRESLERTPPELAADIVDRGIYLTGGGALLRGLDLLMREVTNLNIRVAQDPLTCVVRGAGKILEKPELYEKVILSGHRD
ncbi:MAG TPA: rod shape-determining protein [Candidatus Eisenbacteria bacterium]|nr:rod shape-determining protein [Candidatus Eisenbacteria bacterium]